MELVANYYLHISLAYLAIDDTNNAYTNADAGFRTRLEYRYPIVFNDYKNNINKSSLDKILNQYRWEQDELLGDLIFIMSLVYFRHYGVYPDSMIKLAARMGSSMAAEVL